MAEAAEIPIKKEAEPLRTREDFERYIDENAPKHGVSPAKVKNVVDCETGSTWNPTIIGDQGRSYGLAQIFLPGHSQITKEMAVSPKYALDYLMSHWYTDTWTCQHGIK